MDENRPIVDEFMERVANRELIDEIMFENHPETFDLSPELEQRLNELWNIENDTKELVKAIRDKLGVDYAKDHIGTWSKESLIEYHMGNNRVGDIGAIYFALKECNSKISAIRPIFEAKPTTFELAMHDLEYIENIINSNSKDERIYFHVKEAYDYWNGLPKEELINEITL